MSNANDWNQDPVPYQDPNPNPNPNPYAAPTSVFEDDFRGEYQPWAGRTLATRGQRLASAIIDSLAYGVAMGPVFFILAFQEASGGGGDETITIVAVAIFGILCLALLVYNLMRLHSHQQTIGKQVMGIQIIRADLQTPVTLGRILGLRMFPLVLLSMIPFIGSIVGLVDPLLIFQESQQCGHDLVADTNVVLYEA